MNKDVKIYIEDILDSIVKIEEYITRTDKNSFQEDTQLQDAIIRRLEKARFKEEKAKVRQKREEENALKRRRKIQKQRKKENKDNEKKKNTINKIQQ